MKIKNIGLLVATSAVLASCGKFNLHKITYKVVPDPLELRGDSVEITVNAEYPKKTIPKKSTAEATPVLKFKGGEKDYKTLYFKGEKMEGAQGTTINWAGGSFKYNSKIAYVDGMQESELHVKGKGYNKKGKLKYEGITETPIAYGVITTPLWTQKDDQFVYGKHAYGPIYLTKKVTAYFPYNSASLRGSEKDSVAKGSFNKFVQDQIADGGTFEKVEINGWASPDGEETRNNDLSAQRAKEVEKYAASYFKGKKVTVTTDAKGNGEDMNGFNTLANSSNVEGKNDFISQVKSGASNSQLKAKGGKAFNEFEKEVLSPLRKAEMVLTVKQREKTNDELVKLAKEDVKKLTLEEALYTVETLIEDDATKVQILENIAKEFPEDYRATNNIGVIYAKQGKLDEALTKFLEAEKIAPSEAAVKNNIGAIYMRKGDKEQALAYYKQGAGSKENNHNLGNVYILQGKYNEAVSAYSDECSFNAALAKLLNGNPEKVNEILDCSPEKETAAAYYLRAIAAARTNSTNTAISNLKEAIAKDPSLKAKAKSDLEFRNLRENSEFKSLVN